MMNQSGGPARLAIALAILAVPGFASAGVVQRGNDSLRTGWYPDQSSLTPQLVTGGSFGQLFSTTVTGQVYAQPLVANGRVFVATEANWIYGIDATSGAIQWSRNLGVPFNAGTDLACSDLVPTIGVTSTPVIDDVANTAYFTSKTYASGTSGPGLWQMHAVDLATGVERSGFPVTIQGTAQNAPLQTFNPTKQMQRPALLLMNGVVYAAFGAHCDATPYQGWIAGVSTSGTLVALFSDRVGDNTVSGAGIWMSGAGLVSDRSGSLFFATGNAFGGGTPASAIPGNQPPTSLGESMVRLDVQANGSLKAVDFFTPFDGPTMDSNDVDFGSGGPVGLPGQYFGTASIPNLMVHQGKQGYLYILNRDNLGGARMGSGGGDAVVSRTGPYGGVWSHPAVWPGDGGYIYVAANQGAFSAFKYGLDGSGNPTFSMAGNTGADHFGFGSSPPLVTSSGAASGSALVWIIWSPDGTGTGAQLRAYNPIPQAGVLTKVYAAPIGTASKFAPPFVSNNRIFVGTRDGHLLAFGAPVSTLLTGSPVNFPNTIVGQSSVQTATLTATGNVTVTALSSSDTQFVLGAPSIALPATLTNGQTLTVPVTFTPAKAALIAGTLNVTTNSGNLAVAMSGQGLSPTGVLTASPTLLSFGGTAVGAVLTGSVTFSNTGATALTIQQVTPPSAPFSATGLPVVGSSLAPGTSITSTVTFAPTAVGQFTGAVTVVSSNGTQSVSLSGSAAPPGVLTISPLSLDYGTVAVGASKSLTFNVSNTGGTTLTITRSKPPALGQFKAVTALAEGTQLTPNQSVTITVSFAPTTGGALADSWSLNCDQPNSVAQSVNFTGTGDASGVVVIPDPVAGGWTLNGNASLLGTTAGSLLQLTPATAYASGSAFWPTAVSSANLTASFDATIGSGTGADGLTFTLADPAAGAKPTSLGTTGSGLGFTGIPGWAVGLVTYNNGPANFVGISNGGPAYGSPNWVVTTTSVPALRPATHHVQVSVANGTMTVSVDSVAVLTQAVTLPSSVLVGFSGGNGGNYDQHAVANVQISTHASPAALSVNPTSLAFGNVQTGSSASQPVTISNTGGAALTISGITGPAAPYTVTGLPATGSTLAAGQSVTATVTFAPTAVGATTDSLVVSSSAGSATVALSGSGVAPAPAALSVTPGSLSFGSVSTGAQASQTVSIANTGGSALTINSTTGPVAPFSATGLPAAGTVLAAGQTVTATVIFQPTAAGSATGSLTVASTAGSATVSLSGTGVTGTVIPDPSAGGWTLNGNASLLGTTPGSLLQLTPATAYNSGSAFWPTAVATANLTATFDLTIGSGTGGDGMTFILADPAAGAKPTSLGYAGSGLGFSGIPGWAVGFVTYQYAPANFVGISNGGPANGSPNWVVKTTNVPPLRTAVRHVKVAMANGTMTVSVDGTVVLTQAVTVPANALVGFSGGNGATFDQHAVSNVQISTAATPGVLAVTPGSVSFGSIQTGGTSSQPISLSNTGGSTLTLNGYTLPAAPFSASGLPAAGTTLAPGATLNATVTFSPTAAGAANDSLVVTSTAGNGTVALSGTGVSPSPGVLSVTPGSVSFGSIQTGGTSSQPISISNTGGSTLTLNGYTMPSAPFSASGLPAAGTTLAPGVTLNATVTFSPTAVGAASGSLLVASSAGNSTVALSGSGVAPPPAALSVTPGSLSFGSVTTGAQASQTVSIANTGGSALTINSTTGPVAPFSATGLPAAGTVLAAGQTVTATVTFQPTAAGAASGSLTVASTAGSATVSLSGTGATGTVIQDPSAGGWTLNGNASLLGTTPGSLLQLTPATAYNSGSAFWPTAVSSANLTANFDVTIGGGTGADGMTFILADPAAGAKPTSLGYAGSGLGFSGIPGWAVGFVTYSGGPANFVGISNGGPANGSPNWVATTTNVPPLRTGTHHVKVAVSGGVMTVSVDGAVVLTQAVTLPASTLVGFSGGSGGLYDQHAVANVQLSAP